MKKKESEYPGNSARKQLSKDITSSSIRSLNRGHVSITQTFARVSGVMIYPVIALSELVNAHYTDATEKNYAIAKQLRNNEINATEAKAYFENKKTTSLDVAINILFFVLTIAAASSIILTNSVLTASIGPVALGIFAILSIAKSLLNIGIALTKYLSADNKEEQEEQQRALLDNSISLITMLALSAFLFFYPIHGMIITTIFITTAALSMVYLGNHTYQTRKEYEKSEAALIQAYNDKLQTLPNVDRFATFNDNQPALSSVAHKITPPKKTKDQEKNQQLTVDAVVNDQEIKTKKSRTKYKGRREEPRPSTRFSKKRDPKPRGKKRANH